MASPDRDLEGLQRWMQQAVVGAGPVAQAESEILPSRTLTADERVAIYHRMYPVRMHDALASDYPALAHFLGSDGFDALVRRYIEVHPSRSYTLNRLGDHFPEFVAQDTSLPRPGFCSDLARLEHAMALVFDAPENPLLDAAAVAALGEGVAAIPLRPIEAFRLLELRYPAGAYVDSVRDESHDHPRLVRRAGRVAVYRNRYVLRRLELDKAQFALLAALESGATLGEAVMQALGRARRPLSPDAFFQWFRDWVAAGLFRALEPA